MNRTCIARTRAPCRQTKPSSIRVVQFALGLVFAFGSSVVQTSTAASWVTNSPLITARFGHAATLLTNGQVLIVGGGVSDGDTDSVELFDPTTGAWTDTTPLQDLRSSPTLTALNNGLVLVTGGQGQTGGLSRTELYNPGTSLWETNGALNTGRHGHSTTLLIDGRVLVAGGYAGLNPWNHELASAEIYDPLTRVWTTTGSLTSSRQQHTATRLANGHVLVVGGVQGNQLASSAELYNPDLGTWAPTNAMTAGRRLHTATLLSDGQVLVVGGFGETNNVAVAELYDPSIGTWTTTGALNFPRHAHTATLMLNGEVLVTGGDGFPDDWRFSTELYHPATGTWTNTASLNAARGYHTATLLSSGNVLVAGGFGNGDPISSTELYVEAIPFALVNPTALPSGAFQFEFTNTPGLSFSALATTNLPLTLSNWTVLGGVTEVSPGQFQFTDLQATNRPQRFYRVQEN